MAPLYKYLERAEEYIDQANARGGECPECPRCGMFHKPLVWWTLLNGSWLDSKLPEPYDGSPDYAFAYTTCPVTEQPIIFRLSDVPEAFEPLS